MTPQLQPFRAAIRVRRRSVAALAIASFIGLIAFGWPFIASPGAFSSAQTAPLMFGVLLGLVLAVVFAEIADGGIDAKAVAMLGVLAAINAALRPLGGGTAGIETVFFILVLAGRVFGPGFGFALGCTSLFASALLTGGVGPWMPYQMFGCAWIGMLAGLLPPLRGKAELALLAIYGAVAGYVFGFLLNLSFWPFAVDPGSSIAYRPGLPFIAELHRYLVFDASTSLGWDTGRAVTTALAILIIGPAALSAFRRIARRANFQPNPTFAPTDVAGPGAARPCHDEVMRVQRFGARVAAGPRGSGVIVVPFDPDAVWGAKAEHPAGGTINGKQVRGKIAPSDCGWAFTVSPMWMRDTEIGTGDDVVAELAPEGPQRSDLADDIAAALAANPDAAAFFDTLAQFYRKAYLRWIDSTTRRPELRAARIAEVVALLAAGIKQRPRASSSGDS